MVRQPSARDAGVLAFTAHSVVFTDEDPDWVRSVLTGTPGDALAATMNPYFLGALMARGGRHMNTVDLLTVAPALPGGPGIALREIEDPEHPRVARAMKYRDEVRVWAADGGVVILGRGVAGRWETAIEVAEESRSRSGWANGSRGRPGTWCRTRWCGPSSRRGTPAVCGRSRRRAIGRWARRPCSSWGECSSDQLRHGL